ncbi:MAG: AAA family ATPase [Prevotellaceae bacterium]|jgi:energy-coupling factor transporter ATP-binding protein EcfA2|nr:AAA family ATPase [Prevotellaceae bacterium]
MNIDNSHITISEIEGVKLDLTNEEFNNAVDFVQHTNRLIYLTGKAGTGKTTFLKYIKETVKKNMVILAPTGVAAINAGGQTIHSFFKIKPSVYIPNDRKLRTTYNITDVDKSTIYDNFQYNKEKLEIIRGLEILIIDEISMVRCDLLDVVDRLLRVYRKRINEPFGGVQVILIGDTFQLPPIKKKDEWDILKQFYENHFFFSAQVIKENQPVYIELKKIYRQKEQEFIDLLNRVRVNQVTQNEINQLNAKFNPIFSPPKNENYIILATHNDIVDRTNLTKLEELPSELKIFLATVIGDFSENIMPTDKALQLKENAQIMFIKNDTNKRYYNGKIAKLIKIDDDGIVAELSEGNQIIVEKETWKNIKYTWNDKERKIEEEVIGTFTQYPIKLAWAITVHKSQGLTFEKVIADLGRAFDSGQVYVALSRCSTFNGLILRTQLNRTAIKTSPEVLEFARNEMPSTLVIQELNSGKADFYYEKVRSSLKQFQFEDAYDSLMSAIKYRNDIETDRFKKYFVLFASRLAFYKKMYYFNQNKLNESILKNTDLQMNIEVLSNALSERIKKITEQNTSIKLLLNKIKEVEISNNDYQTTFENLQVEFENKDEIIEQLDDNNIELGKNLQTALSTIKKYKQEIEMLNQEIKRQQNLKWYHKIVGKE